MVLTVKFSVGEKGNAAKVLEWFKGHKDLGYAEALEEVVKESRRELALR